MGSIPLELNSGDELNIIENEGQFFYSEFEFQFKA
jgi:hypothetical protein